MKIEMMHETTVLMHNRCLVNTAVIIVIMAVIVIVVVVITIITIGS